ncbi:glycosyl hydrolase family 8 [Phyllobacterium sp. SB3]|uniref:glycosyl hydrolase family 8 n=1 Tax=Phyllobacterium sp. SB3 TaxID=3156073 RepID=UPI0032AF6296
MRQICILLALFVSLGSEIAMAQPNDTTRITQADWAAYKARFVDEAGRIIDDANGNISHSEGQGYGLLLAYLANSKADFDLIWSFTRTEFIIRDDGLAAWKWEPGTKPHITDINNASDGDILIAYALALAGSAWGRADLTQNAELMIQSIGKFNVIDNQGRLLLLPGSSGFSQTDRDDGPVINLSYWVFEAFPHFAAIDKTVDWNKLSDAGISLLDESGGGAGTLPADWLSAKTRLRPAKGFKAEFGYNGLRIPLYLMRAGLTDRKRLAQLRHLMAPDGTNLAVIDVSNGIVTETLADPGYIIIPALIDCVLERKKLPDSVKTFSPTLYYPSTLHLLSLSFAHSQHPECL